MTRKIIARYWLLLPLLLLIVVLRDWVEAPPRTPDEETIDMRTSEADYYLERFRTQKFDENGDLHYEVRGDTLTHFPADDRADIVAPAVALLRPDITWTLTAREGRLDQNPEIFTLIGDVDIRRRGDAIEAVRIETDELTVALDDNQVSTDKPIEIIAESWRLQAVGLQSSIDEGKLDLLSNVSGRFDVARP